MSYVIQFLMCYLLWVLLVWPFSSAAASGGALAPGGAQDLLAGILVAAASAAIFGRVFPRHPGRVLHPLRYLWLLVYIPVVIWACLVANLDVAYRVLHLRLPIRPGIVKVRTGLKSEMGKIILANSITLTPGTLTVDIVGQDLYVHWINVSSDSAQLRAEIILGQFEEILKRVFD